LGAALDGETGRHNAVEDPGEAKARTQRYAAQVHKEFFASASHSLYM
jgi:hypothetical protein